MNGIAARGRLDIANIRPRCVFAIYAIENVRPPAWRNADLRATVRILCLFRVR